jgi:hypothetical protein
MKRKCQALGMLRVRQRPQAFVCGSLERPSERATYVGTLPHLTNV